jgi:hypothetical protein
MSNSATMDAGFLGYRQFFQDWKTHGKIDKNHGPENKSAYRLEQVKKHSEKVFPDTGPNKQNFLSDLFRGFHPKNIFFATKEEVQTAHNEHKAKYPLAVAEEGNPLTEAQHKQNEINTGKAAKETLHSLRWGVLDKATNAALTAQSVIRVLSDGWNFFSTDQKGTALTNLAADTAGLAVNFLPIRGAAANLATQFAISSLLPGFLYSIFGGLDANPGQGQQQQMAYQQSPNPNGMPAQSNYLANGLNRLSQPQSGENFSYCV